MALKIINNAFEEVIGNNILYGATKITIYGGRTRYYYFDENTSINRQQDIKSILDNIGDMEKDVEGQLSIRVRDWLKKKPRIIYRKKVK